MVFLRLVVLRFLVYLRLAARERVVELDFLRRFLRLPVAVKPILESTSLIALLTVCSTSSSKMLFMIALIPLVRWFVGRGRGARRPYCP